MNMLLHGVKDSEFEIYHGDTLTNDWDMLRETNPAKKPAFDAVVANPPFSYRWEPLTLPRSTRGGENSAAESVTDPTRGSQRCADSTVDCILAVHSRRGGLMALQFSVVGDHVYKSRPAGAWRVRDLNERARLRARASNTLPSGQRLNSFWKRVIAQGHIGMRCAIALACLVLFALGSFAQSAPAIAQPTKLTIDAKFVVSCAVDKSSGAIWIGTEDQGVWRISAGQATHFTTADGLGDDDAYALAVDLKGRVWVGHSSHGVSVFDGTGCWRNYDVTSGPWGSRVFAMAVCPIDGDVWIATEAGLTRYAAKTDTWSNTDRSTGLPANEANALAFNAAGDLFVGLQYGGVTIARRSENYRAWQSTSGPDEMPATPTGTGLPTPLIDAILVVRDGTIYAGTTRRAGVQPGRWQIVEVPARQRLAAACEGEL